jgi:hypothetical protein
LPTIRSTLMFNTGFQQITNQIFEWQRGSNRKIVIFQRPASFKQ